MFQTNPKDVPNYAKGTTSSKMRAGQLAVPVPKIPTPRLPPARLQPTVRRNEDMMSNRRPPPRPNNIRNVAAAPTVSTSTTGLMESATVGTQATYDPLCDACIEHRKKIGLLTECLQTTEGELVEVTSENVRLKRLLAAAEEKISLLTRGRCPDSVPLYVKSINNVFHRHWVPEKLRDEFATYEFDLPNHGNRQQKKWKVFKLAFKTLHHKIYQRTRDLDDRLQINLDGGLSTTLEKSKIDDYINYDAHADLSMDQPTDEFFYKSIGSLLCDRCVVSPTFIVKIRNPM